MLPVQSHPELGADQPENVHAIKYSRLKILNTSPQYRRTPATDSPACITNAHLSPLEAPTYKAKKPLLFWEIGTIFSEKLES
jgi:hypothetical protein